jgi:hypothetical protein
MEENPYSHDLNADLKYLVLKVKILQVISPSSPEITGLVDRIKNIHGDSNANGIAIQSYGGFLTVDY